jgi:hypothetical protein
MCSANISHETTTLKFEDCIATIEDEDTKKAYERWWHQSGGLVEKEALLTLWLNNLHL